MDFEITEEIEQQLKHQGIAALQAADGEIFVLTTEMLARLTKAAQSNAQGRVIVFVKRRPSA
jgi:hypothetical protein